MENKYSVCKDENGKVILVSIEKPNGDVEIKEIKNINDNAKYMEELRSIDAEYNDFFCKFFSGKVTLEKDAYFEKIEKKERKQKNKFLKKNNLQDDEMKLLGKILLTEFVGDLSKREVEFLAKTNPKIKDLFSRNACGAQIEFEKTRDTLINSIFTNSESKNKKIKEFLFSYVNGPKRPVGFAKKKGMPFLHEASSRKIEDFKNSDVYDKNSIINQLKDIHKTSQEEVSLYLKICQKAFIDNLSDEERKFVNVRSQEDYQTYLFWNMFILGYEKCYDPSVVEIVDPTEQRSLRTLIFDYEYRRVYDDLKSSNEKKRTIFKELKESGVIENEEQEKYYKKELDNVIITNNSSEITNNFLEKTKFRKRK